MSIASNISPARVEANRKNAQKSTGPRTVEGKARSRLNGLVHGLRAETLILPGEDEDEYKQRREDWARELRPESTLEACLVETMVASSWRMERCRKAEKAALTRQILDAEDELEMTRRAEVRRLAAQLAADPRGVAERLEQLAEGCAWKAGRWERLGEALEGAGCWEPSEFHLALHLLGTRPEDLFIDPLARDVACAYLAIAYDHTPSTSEARASLAIRPPGETLATGEWARQVARLVDEVSEPEEAMAYLKRVIENERSALAESRRTCAERHERDRLLARDRATFDASAEGVARSRYEMMHVRAFRGALRDLMLLRKARPEPEEEPEGAVLVSLDEVARTVEPPPQVESATEGEAASRGAAEAEPGGSEMSSGSSLEAPSEAKRYGGSVAVGGPDRVDSGPISDGEPPTG